MTIHVLLVTHPGIGTAMLNIATRIMGTCVVPTRCLEVPPDADLDPILETARRQIDENRTPDGVLILTDLFGATPHNLATRLDNTPDTRLVSGLNLSMLIRVFNYPDEDLDSLVEKALEGGARGIQTSRPEGT